MILTDTIYTTAKGQGLIKKKCQLEQRECNPKFCICKEVWCKGNLTGEIIEL